MQPAPMIYMYEVNLDLAVTARLKQIAIWRRGDACVQKCVDTKQSRIVQLLGAAAASTARYELHRYTNSVQSPMQPAPMYVR